MKQKESKRNIFYYLRVWFCIIRAGVSRSYIYRTEVFIRFIRTVFVLCIQLFLLNVVFGNNDLYVGWSKSEAYLVMGIWNLVNYLGWSFFGVNLLYLESKVLDGKFDYILLKPLSSSWFASFSDFFIYNFVTSLSGVVLVGYYIYLEYTKLNWGNLVLGIAAICISISIWYAIYLLFASFTISKPRNGFLSVAKELIGVTKYPIDIFGETFKLLFYTVIPIAFLTTVPAGVIIGKFNYIYILIGVLISFLMIRIANNVWKSNVREYTSASS